MSDQDWSRFHQRWANLKPPLRANSEVIDAIRTAIDGHRQHALLLGVTPELCDIAKSTIAVDKSENMIAQIWPGNSGQRQAVLGNWLSMPLQRREFSAVIGDGSLNAIAYSDFGTLFAQLEKVLLRQSRIAIRIYETPTPGESIDLIYAAAMDGQIRGFHAFKWRLAMAIASEGREPSVSVKYIHEVFQLRFPDRMALSSATNWTRDEIDEIDAYESQSLVYAFPNRAEILASMPPAFRNPRFVDSGTYELAERCPILVADFHP